ncbi:MAG: SDR family NAD(P)-dependent oxidoreductase [Rhodospirillaceae bacterium]|jgi:NAD(P)-dependent dehydrogenase (short-subunit alcohol dehydrogenase family)|nr:SDR family NAD(P)-dependent oxidoreductase [Rhodospirillaceae bacterium]
MNEMHRPARLDPKDRVAMISGANRGIGLAIARRLYEDGYNLSLGARDTDALAAATARMEDRRVLRHAFDATRREDAARWAEATAAQFGRIDIVINNAGISGRFAFDALDEDVLDNMWEVNVKAPYRVISAALPHLRACGEGRIVNVVSLAGMRQLTSSAAYTISKFAAMGLTHSARHYLFEDGIRVTALCPGDTDTDMTVHSPRPNEEKTQPEDLAEIVSHVIALPNTASIATVPVNCIAEAFL